MWNRSEVPTRSSREQFALCRGQITARPPGNRSPTCPNRPAKWRHLGGAAGTNRGTITAEGTPPKAKTAGSVWGLSDPTAWPLGRFSVRCFPNGQPTWVEKKRIHYMPGVRTDVALSCYQVDILWGLSGFSSYCRPIDAQPQACGLGSGFKTILNAC